MLREMLARRVTHSLLIIVLGSLVYANMFKVPFQLDDVRNIAENPVVRDFSFSATPEDLRGVLRYEAFRSRFVGFFTFQLNYRIHGLDVTGYHLVNLIIHLVNALLVYALIVLSLRTPVLRGSRLSDQKQWVAMFAASMFVAHPVNTQAVTYIVQRLASLVTLFYLSSIACYIKSRFSDGKSRWIYYTGALVLAMLAMKTKENAFTLPLAIALYEFMFFREERLGRRALLLLPVLLTMLIIPLTFLDLDKPAAEVMADMSERTTVRGMSRFTYLLTELRVMVTYFRLLVLPINQNLDYDYPMYTSLTQGPVLLSLAFIVVLMVLAVYLHRREEPAARLASFGIVFFFLALSVESTLVPLSPIFEHRLYLPGGGMMMALSVGAAWLHGRQSSSNVKKALVAAAVTIVIMLGALTLERNTVWLSEERLWADVVQKAPGNAGGYSNLATAYFFKGDLAKARIYYFDALRLDPYHAIAHNNLGLIYIREHKPQAAVDHFRKAVLVFPTFAEAYNNLGIALESLDANEEALRNFRIAAHLKPGLADAHANLGRLYFKMGDIGNARAELSKALNLDPLDSESRRLLDVLSYRK